MWEGRVPLGGPPLSLGGRLSLVAAAAPPAGTPRLAKGCTETRVGPRGRPLTVYVPVAGSIVAPLEVLDSSWWKVTNPPGMGAFWNVTFPDTVPVPPPQPAAAITRASKGSNAK